MDFKIVVICVCRRICASENACATAWVWRSEGMFVELVLSLHHRVGSRVRTRVLGLCCTPYHCPPNHHASLKRVF